MDSHGWIRELMILLSSLTYTEVLEKRQGLKVDVSRASPIAKDEINEERMRELAQPMLKNQCGSVSAKGG